MAFQGYSQTSQSNGILEEVTLQLKWFHQFQFAGYYMAVEKGYYRDIGLRVNLKPGGPKTNVNEEVLSGRAEFGILASELIQKRVKGEPLVLLAVVMQHSIRALISLADSQIHSPSDLIGRTIMLNANEQTEFLAMLNAEGISSESIKIIPKNKQAIEKLINKEIAAMNGSIANQPYIFAEKGIAVNLIRPITYGIDFYGDSIFTSEDEVEQHPERVRAFRKASLKGWAYAMGHIDETVGIITDTYNQQKSREQLQYEARALRKLILPDLVELGHINPQRIDRIAQIYNETSIIPSAYSLKGFIYDPEDKTYSTWIWRIVYFGVFVIVSFTLGLIILLFLNFQLKKIVNRRTADLLSGNERLRNEITERKQAEKALQESQHKLSAHIKSTPMGVMEINNDFMITSWNPGAEKIFGYSAEEVIGKSSFDILVPDYEYDVVKKIHLSENPRVSDQVNDNKTKDGQIITCHWFNTPMLDVDGRVLGLTAVCQNITDQIKAEQVLEKRILALTRPLDDTRNVLFGDLFNLDDIQIIQDDFARATGVASIITQLNGVPITAPSNFSRLCNDIIRKTDKGQVNCHKSDATIGRFNPDGPNIQPCMSCGLWDAGAAISVGGKHIANWLIGQVRDETQSEKSVRAYAYEIGVSETEMVNAFYEVPVMSRDNFEKIARALFTLANQISTAAFQNVQQARFISDRKQAENALRDSEEKYRTVIENANESIIILQGYEFKFINPKTCELTGYSEQELLSKPFLELIHPDDRKTINDNYFSRQSGEILNETYLIRVIGKQGYMTWVEVKPVIINWAGEIAILCFISDITARRQAEEVLLKSRDLLETEVKARTIAYKKAKEEAELANELKTEFLANMSHELRTPMHHILAYSKNGLEKINKVKKEKLQHYFSQIRISGVRLMSLINDLLDLSKLEAGRMDFELIKTDLALLVGNLISEFSPVAKEKSIDFQLKKSELLTTVLCDELKIGQVLRNLISNALKFTTIGKSISISFDLEELPDRRKRTGEKITPALVVRVKDEGAGIPESELETIFDKFIQSSRTKTRAGGTGLGLSICREIINAHHGKIWAENNSTGGATFSFVLPYDQAVV
ncbi:MAG: ABC transporter substrate-binding protein [Deltaproteobacteria bacterium]|nr:ABC transporter substrate-binding protein [Deltaproteobacteria bacterium]